MDQVSGAIEPVRVLLAEVGIFLPKLLIAVIILVAGWLIAKVVRVAFTKGLRLINFNVLAERAGVDDFLKQGDIKMDTVGIIAVLAYWVVVLLAVMMAFNSLGLSYVTDLIGKIVLFLPKVIVAVLILAIGAYFARFVARIVSTYAKNVGSEDADLLGRIAMYATMVFVVLIALDQVSIGGDIIRQTFLIILAGVVLALAIAFGIGGQKWAGQLLERSWPKKGG